MAWFGLVWFGLGWVFCRQKLTPVSERLCFFVEQEIVSSTMAKITGFHQRIRKGNFFIFKVSLSGRRGKEGRRKKKEERGRKVWNGMEWNGVRMAYTSQRAKANFFFLAYLEHCLLLDQSRKQQCQSPSSPRNLLLR